MNEICCYTFIHLLNNKGSLCGYFSKSPGHKVCQNFQGLSPLDTLFFLWNLSFLTIFLPLPPGILIYDIFYRWPLKTISWYLLTTLTQVIHKWQSIFDMLTPIRKECIWCIVWWYLHGFDFRWQGRKMLQEILLMIFNVISYFKKKADLLKAVTE